MGLSGFSLFDYYGQCCYEHLSTSFCKKLGFISLAVGNLDQIVTPSITFQGAACVVQNACTILHAQQHFTRIPVSLHPYQYLFKAVSSSHRAQLAGP